MNETSPPLTLVPLIDLICAVVDVKDDGFNGLTCGMIVLN
jgi:hypothetical protein